MADLTVTFTRTVDDIPCSTIFVTRDLGHCFWLDSERHLVSRMTRDGGVSWDELVRRAEGPITRVEVWFLPHAWTIRVDLWSAIRGRWTILLPLEADGAVMERRESVRLDHGEQ